MYYTGRCSAGDGVYKTYCCGCDLGIISGSEFPSCPRCLQPTDWFFVEPVIPGARREPPCD